MPLSEAQIKALVLKELPDAEIAIQDVKGTGDHYVLRVGSQAFRGKTRIEQHQLIYKSLEGHIGAALHALALQTYVL